VRHVVREHRVRIFGLGLPIEKCFFSHSTRPQSMVDQTADIKENGQRLPQFSPGGFRNENRRWQASQVDKPVVTNLRVNGLSSSRSESSEYTDPSPVW
jgi:hypothetical protein